MVYECSEVDMLAACMLFWLGKLVQHLAAFREVGEVDDTFTQRLATDPHCIYTVIILFLLSLNNLSEIETLYLKYQF